MEIKITYLFKEIFLIFSWIMIFFSNSIENSQIFLTSIMIYSGAVIFDLVFFAVEAKSKASSALRGAYYISIALAVLNGLITAVAVFGAFNCIVISNANDMYKLVIKEGTLTDIYKEIASFGISLSVYLLLVLLFGVLEAVPGLLILKDKNQKQVDSSD